MAKDKFCLNGEEGNSSFVANPLGHAKCKRRDHQAQSGEVFWLKRDKAGPGAKTAA